MEVPYALLFVSAVYALTLLAILLDFLQAKMLGDVLSKEASARRGLLYVYLFKTLSEVAVIWLIVAFFGQIWMGWIKF